MKTLKLISKAGRKNYFFGEINSKGQEVVATFNSPEEMLEFFSLRSENGNWYVNLPWTKEIINAEYSQSRTYYSRFELSKIKNCTKIFNQRAK